MAFVPFDNLSTGQKSEVIAVRLKWPLADLSRCEFWIKPDGHMSRKLGHHRLTKEANKAIYAKFKDEPRSKGDLLDWKPGVTFHFDNHHRKNATN